MEPGFSLRLDHDAVDLLARAGNGWEELGRADFADPELDGRLAELRDLAAALSPDGFATKLVLPASQILYTEADAPGPDDDARRLQIAGALEGRTPYAVEDLVFDWAEQDGSIRVAVVARDTLAEAEAFAEEHGFHPLCFASAPDPDQFPREPSFGLTRSGAKRLPEGGNLIGDAEPERLAEAASAATDAEIEIGNAEEPTGSGAPIAPKPERTDPSTTAPEPAQQSADAADAPDGDTERSEEPEQAMIISADISADDITDETLPPPSERVVTESAGRNDAETGLGITDALMRDDADDLPPADQPHSDPDDPLQDDLAAELGPEPVPAGEAAEAPFIAVDDMPDIDETADLPVIPAAPSFASRRVGPAIPAGKPETPALTARPARFNLPGSDRSMPERNRGVTGADMAVDDVPVDEPSIPTPRGKASRVPSAHLTDAGHGTRAQILERKKAAEPVAPAADRPKPGPLDIGLGTRSAPPLRLRLGLVLVAALLVLMALVGFGSLWFTDASDPSTPTTVADAPAITEPAEPVTEPEAPTEVAATAPEPEADRIDVVEPPEDTTPPASESTVEENLAAAAPDLSAPDAGTIWTAPPTADETPPPSAEVPPSIGTDSDSGADEAPVLSLLAPATTSADPGLEPQPVPPPPGTEYQFDANGFIVPTPDGVQTPDGVTIFAGRPPVAPIPRPAALLPSAEPEPEAAETAPAPEGEPEATAPSEAAPSDTTTAEAPTAPAEVEPLPAPVDPAHAALKPKVRPAALVAATEARIAREEAEAQALAEALASATPQAVATSLRPRARPEGLRPVVIAATPAVDDAVAAAVAASLAAPKVPQQAASQAAPQVEIDEPEPVSAAPNIPTTATVAKQATIKNAINLSEISLIGIYGSSANRRALVRMPNGRYVKLKIGDRLDGGQVAAIGASELSYVKRGKTIVLKILKNG
ncbi:hypothetical protein QKW60_11520 [Defluviimonas aestuarii]|uniref:hypothetical protein n=1 Tax=Albidovulum aestuarii TaxID=1130726 RepID=UPI00249A963F|nr:hypothetical protein [Defluviimonas aestuarii]MDI3337042.1 hypothetical protein [Defluviimonas aestuarii]